MNRRDHRAGKTPAPGKAASPDPAALYQAGVAHLRAGRMLDAQVCGQRALTADPGHADSLHLMSLITIDAGHFPVTVKVNAEDASAKTELALDVVGQPQLQLAGRDGLLSARAVAAQQSSIPVLVTNSGTAPADNVKLNASAPTGWKVTFQPETIERLVPGKDAEVQALITPSEKSLAGDYMVSVRANSRGESASSQFRITVATSTVWGMAGAGVIGVALLLMLGAVARFGRR